MVVIKKGIKILCVLLLMIYVSCSKEQSTLNLLQGKWKLTKQKTINKNKVNETTPKNVFFDFKQCEFVEGKFCQAVLDDNGNRIEFQYRIGKKGKTIITKDPFDSSIRNNNITELSKSKLVYTSLINNVLIEMSLEK